MVAKMSAAYEKLKSIPARDKMRPLGQMAYETIPPADESKYLLQELLAKFQGKSRIPILNKDNSIRYIIHQSMLDQYLRRVALQQVSIPTGKTASQLTLQDLFDSNPQYKSLFENTIAFVPESASLADAKTAMEKVPNCEDVFITHAGQQNEPVIGWITNNTITDNGQV